MKDLEEVDGYRRSVFETIKGRRSIRKYKPRAVENEKIRRCIEAACHAPSAHNSQPWKFVIVKDPVKIQKLSKTQKYSAFLKSAPVVIVALADESKSNHFVEDVSCAIMLLMLEAHELGLGTCWNAVYDPSSKTRAREKYVKAVVGIPEKYRVIANIGVGYPQEKPEEKGVMGFREATRL